jgi:hypothetical protein
MSKAEEYRACAAECLRLALIALESGAKIYLLDSAERWLDMAETAELPDSEDEAATLHWNSDLIGSPPS